MIQYIQLFLGVTIGQGLMTSIMVYNYQKELKISYWKAVGAYLEAEVGFYVIGAFGLLALLFIMSEFIDLHITKEDLRSITAKSWKENLQLFFKTASLLVGLFVQYIAFKVRSVGKVAIDNASAKLGG